jgi:hypothetical protein
MNQQPSLCPAITAVRTNVANLSDAAMWKIRRARFARNRQKSVRSLRDSVKRSPTKSTAKGNRPSQGASRPIIPWVPFNLNKVPVPPLEPPHLEVSGRAEGVLGREFGVQAIDRVFHNTFVVLGDG